MASNARPLTYKPRNMPKYGPICVHEDKVPGIMPIPFTLDDIDDKPPINGAGDGTQMKPKRDGVKLDLPYIHSSARAQYFSSYRKSEHTEKTFREFRNTMKMSIPSDASPGCQTIKLQLPRLDALENLQRNLKKKIALYLAGKTVSFTVKGQEVSLSRSAAHIQKAKIRAHNGKRTEADPELTPWLELVAPYGWINSMDVSEQTLTTIRKAWKNTGKPFVQLDTSIVAKQLDVSMKQINSLSVMPNVKCITHQDSSRELSCRAIVPDIFKMLALTAWQENRLSRCLFNLCESQNFFIRREVLEKHSTYFLRKSYEKSRDKCNVTIPLDEKKQELFRVQSKELLESTNSFKNFENSLSKLNPEWNVIQLTKLFHHKNRFGASQANGSQAFALFISALVSVNGSRCPFVTYVPPPRIEAGLSKQNIVESFRLLMVKNRKLNEQYKGSRQKYWQLRSQHNVELKTLLDSVEENWIYPWEFLLPGNIMDKSIVSHIRKFLTKVEGLLKSKLTPPVKGVLYKLVENYNQIKPGLQSNLPCFIRWLTQASEVTSQDIATLVIQFGSGLNLQSYKRSPTILVLDQELDLIPWESMNCLKSTPVTRVPSLSMINSLMTLRKLKKEKYAEIIDPRSCGYVLNPDGSLKGVEERLAGYFSGVVSWAGVTGRKPTQTDLESYFQTKDLYLYCGHGSGSAYFSEHRIQRVSCRAVPLLMGCGSVRYKHHGPRSLSTSIVTSLFSATSVCSVGFLYEVTDLECDRVTLELLEHWAPGARGKLPQILSFDPNAKRPIERCLASAVRIARGGATQFVTGAGLVCYGIPVLTHDL